MGQRLCLSIVLISCTVSWLWRKEWVNSRRSAALGSLNSQRTIADEEDGATRVAGFESGKQAAEKSSSSPSNRAPEDLQRGRVT